jgi:two-component system chemotaxis response regulator CheY
VKILIVDDSLFDRKLLVNLLKKAGVKNEILQAGDGEQGLQVLSSHYEEIGLILLDWQMPKIDGIEFMRGVIKVPAVANIPIIMITASGSEENKKLAHDVNPQLAGYIVKPYRSETFINMISPFVEKE